MPLSSYVAVASLVLSSFSAQSNAVPTSTVSSTASSYVFNPNATDNLVVYYGSTIKTTTTNLTNLCNNIDIDIVVLTFIHEIIGGGGYPDINFGVLCSGQTSEMVAADATGLLWCPDLANAIGDCQSVGKKVLISIGGAKGNVTFASVAMANQSAQMLWDIFGAGTAYDVNYRPFGDIVVDGFDIDNENGDSNYWADFVSDLRSLFATQNTKTMYLSAAPQAYYPSPSEPLAMLTQIDFVWPQFYDTPTRGAGEAGFNASIKAWSQRLATGHQPQLMIGALSFNDSGAGGYQAPEDFAITVAQVQSMGFANFGGVTLWDGAYGLLTVDSTGNNYINVTKAALEH